MDEVVKADLESLASFRRALRRFLKVAEATAHAHGITPQQHQALLAVMGMPGREWATMGEIGEALQIQHHAAVGLIDRCQSAGLTAREVDEGDRRVVRVRLTDLGREKLTRITSINLVELRGLEELTQALGQLTGRFQLCGPEER